MLGSNLSFEGSYSSCDEGGVGDGTWLFKPKDEKLEEDGPDDMDSNT